MRKFTSAIMLSTLIPSMSFASGSVYCHKDDDKLPAISLSWGIGHAIGSGRISSYNLTLTGRELLINDSKEATYTRYTS
jgi:hypothetical protein